MCNQSNSQVRTASPTKSAFFHRLPFPLISLVSLDRSIRSIESLKNVSFYIYSDDDDHDFEQWYVGGDTGDVFNDEKHRTIETITVTTRYIDYLNEVAISSIEVTYGDDPFDQFNDQSNCDCLPPLPPPTDATADNTDGSASDGNVDGEGTNGNTSKICATILCQFPVHGDSGQNGCGQGRGESCSTCVMPLNGRKIVAMDVTTLPSPDADRTCDFRPAYISSLTFHTDDGMIHGPFGTVRPVLHKFVNEGMVIGSFWGR